MNVRNLLSESAEGRKIIDNYNARTPRQILLPAEQTFLCNLLTNKIVSDRLNPGRKELRKLTEQITTIFPNEDLDFYVQKSSGGKFANQVFNRLKKIREVDIDYPRLNVKKQKDSEQKDDTNLEPQETSSAVHTWLAALNNPNTSWSNIQFCWKELFQYRRTFIKNNNETNLMAIYDRFPILSNPNAYQLVSVIIKPFIN